MTLPATSWTHPIHHRYPATTWRVLGAEIDREITARLNTYPGRVETGRMTQAEMDWQMQLARAWREDVDRYELAYRPLSEGRPITPPREIRAKHELNWRVRRSALLRELEQRQRFYPDWIAKGRLTEAAAASRIEAVTCLLDLYEYGFDWEPANGTPPAWSEIRPTPEQRATQDELRALLAEIAGRSTTAQQEMFA